MLGRRKDVEDAIDDFQKNTKQTVTMKDGTVHERKQRGDGRCLVAGFCSNPMLTSDMKTKEDAEKIKAWLEASIEFLKEKYGKKLKGVCLHLDESHPHLHFFVVGNAQRLHVGLAAELVNNKRIEDPQTRMDAYKQGCKDFLDAYSEQVGIKHGMERKLDAKPAWRIKDRGLRSQVFELDKRISALEIRVDANPDSGGNGSDIDDLKQERNNIYDSAEKNPRQKLKF
jgi:hypothetical protein